MEGELWSDTPHKRAVIRAERLCDQLLSHHSSYHDHKERMAHAAFLLQVALFGAVMAVEKWPPSWIPFEGRISQIISFLGFTMVLLFLVIFLRWQLYWRKWAALKQAWILQTIMTWVSQPQQPNSDDLKPYGIKHNKLNKKEALIDLMQPWKPLRNVRIPPDVDKDAYPRCLVRSDPKNSDEGTDTFLVEFPLSWAGVPIWLLVFIRTFFAKASMLDYLLGLGDFFSSPSANRVVDFIP